MNHDVFEKLHRLGVGFTICTSDGYRYLGLDEVRRLATEEYTVDEAQAYLEGVTLETYQRWKRWDDDRRGQRCRAVTLKGTTCKLPVRSPGHFGASTFETEAFCDTHWEILNREERDQMKKEYEKKIIVTRTMEDLARVLGLPKSDAAKIEMRSTLEAAINRVIRRRRLSPAQAVKRAGVSERVLKSILSCNSTRVSTDCLVEVAVNLGLRVTLKVS